MFFWVSANRFLKSLKKKKINEILLFWLIMARSYFAIFQQSTYPFCATLCVNRSVGPLLGLLCKSCWKEIWKVFWQSCLCFRLFNYKYKPGVLQRPMLKWYLSQFTRVKWVCFTPFIFKIVVISQRRTFSRRHL